MLLGALGLGAAAVGGGELVEHDVLPGRVRAYALLGLDGPAGTVPDAAPGPVRPGTTDGVDWALCLPPGHAAAGLPVVVALSGKGNDRDYLLNSLGLPQFLAASRLPVAILAVAGGTSYYHPRRDGSDVGGLVLDTLLPQVGQAGLSVARPAFLGWSMGGYGALLLASRRRQAGLPVTAVAATSPALWTSYDAGAPGAFDSAADFTRYGMFERAALLRGVPVRVDCGTGDPFRYSSEDFAAKVGAEHHSSAGGHNGAYWRRVLAAELAWLGHALTT